MSLVAQTAEEIRYGVHNHAVLWLGSIVSSRGLTPCPTVDQIRDDLVVEPLRSLVKAEMLAQRSRRRTASHVAALLERMRSHKRRGVNWGEDHLTDNVRRLPFERFMNCLADAQPDGVAAEDVIKLACRTELQQLHPSALHHVIVRLAKRLLDTYDVKVTVVTTNYDLLLEAAFSTDGIDAPCRVDRCTWSPVTKLPSPLRAFCHRVYGDNLWLFKVHGSIDEPETLVFKANHLCAGIVHPHQFDRLLTRLNDATLYVFAGYGFNDPDLRPVIDRLLAESAKPRKPLAVAIVRSPANSSDVDQTRGLDVLRTEWIAGSRVQQYACDLFDAHNSFLARLAADLDAPPPLPLAQAAEREWDIRCAPKPEDSPMAALDHNAVIEFISILCHYANTGDAQPIIRDLAKHNTDRDRLANRVFLCCASASHKSKYERTLRVCRALRRRHNDPNVAALAYAYESFASAIGFADLPQATRLLHASRQLLSQCNQETRGKVEHLDAHHWLKVLQRLDLGVPLSVHAWGFRHCVRPFARRLVRRLRGAAEMAESQHDIHFSAQIRDLEAQALIYCDDSRTALRVAERAGEFYAAMGHLNGMALIDRTLGWVHLARYDVNSAVRTFSRGLHRALHSPDKSIAAKLAINLTRVLLAMGRLHLGDEQADETTETGVDASALAAAKTLMAASSVSNVQARDGRLVWQFVVARFSDHKPEALVRHQRRFRCLERYPVYHPPKPPRTSD